MNNLLKSLIALLLIQCSFGKPLNAENVSEMPETLTEFQKELFYLTEANTTEFYVNLTIQTAHQTLNDPLILEHHSDEVENLKKNFTMILNKYDEMKNVVATKAGKENEYEEALFHNIVDPYFKLIEYYFGLPEEQQTPGTKLIVKTLTKYKGDEIYTQVAIIKALAKAIADALLNALLARLNPKRTGSICKD